MINKIEINNYKAFKQAELKIRPITILLGENSAGKSSLLKLLLMLSQTYSNNSNKDSALKLNGNLVSLGERKNIFHNKDTNSAMEICFELSSIDYSYILSDLRTQLFGLEYSLQQLKFELNSDTIEFYVANRNKLRLKYSDLINNFSEYSLYEVIDNFSKLKIEINKLITKLTKDDASSILNSTLRHLNYRSSGINKNFLYIDEKLNLNLKQIEHAIRFASKLKQFSSKTINIRYIFNFNNEGNNISIGGLKIYSNNSTIFDYSYHSKINKHHLFYSDLLSKSDLKDYSVKIGESINQNNIDLLDHHAGLSNDFFVNLIRRFIYDSIEPIKTELDITNINYLNPLREYPRRYYLQERNIDNNNSSSFIDSINLINTLNESSYIKSRVNSWMNKFNVNIRISQLEELINKIKIKQKGLDLDITDVGFGISQILPIIVQAYQSENDTITLIEQPEIHLHPKMQAHLADLFIEVCKNKSFIIETHSEYLLKRLRRRISEGKISAEDVCIYFVHQRENNNKAATIEELKISDSGDFDWPKNFYEDDLEDTVEFLKNQK